jgi:hypothetical protein
MKKSRKYIYRKNLLSQFTSQSILIEIQLPLINKKT